MNPEVISKALTASGLLCGVAAFTCARYDNPAAAKVSLCAGIGLLAVNSAVTIYNNNPKK